MSNTKTFTVSLASNNKVKVYNAMTGSIHRIVQLPGGSNIISGPVVFDSGFSVTVKQGTGTYMITYGFPLCNIKTKTHISS
jgi:hypothetical protein